MALTEDDLKAIGSLMDLKLQPLVERMDTRDVEVNARFDKLIKQNEDREREYLMMSEQLKRHDKRFEDIDKRFDGMDARFDSIDGRLERIEKKIDRHDQYFDDLDSRVAAVEQKSA